VQGRAALAKSNPTVSVDVVPTGRLPAAEVLEVAAEVASLPNQLSLGEA